ncbi:MAG: hypothetical protein GVY17_11345 [Cyanobacteria bacterium]|nr:hypothetical protein [Cyanobacteria bacterium GSL.Bin21]
MPCRNCEKTGKELPEWAIQSVHFPKNDFYAQWQKRPSHGDEEKEEAQADQ